MSGADGSNECPAGSVRIETDAECRAAAAAMGKTAGSSFVESESAFPRGCYYGSTNNVAYLNPHALGAGSSGYRLLCAATTGAPPAVNRRARAP
jgi:hypothetical protein